jgi:AraC-like DNA-binding protein
MLIKFMESGKNSENGLDWFEKLCIDIKNTEDYSPGMDLFAMYSDKSYQHMSRVFKEKTGMTPLRYLNIFRLERAATELSLTNKKIIDICYDIGFDSLSHFYRLFKEKYKKTPLMYRNIYGNLNI